MAEALSMAVEKLGDLLIQKGGFLQGVEEQVELLKNELERMQFFLKEAIEKQFNHERVRIWIADIRNLAQYAEDVIETFNSKIDTPRRLLQKCFCFPIHMNHVYKLGKEIESIRARVNDIFKIGEMDGIRDFGHLGTESSRANFALQRRYQWHHRHTDKDVVGLDHDVNFLLNEAILNERSGLSIASITGMVGVGKSTLAREVYNHADVVARFKCRAWVVFSQELNAKQVIKQLMWNLVGRQSNMEELPVEELKGMLYRHLEDKEYFIVLDDMWFQEHWESLADAFPDKQDKTSRLLVTTRNSNLPRTARHALALKPLDPDRSWQLFLKKSIIDDTNGKCPPELEDIGREIVGRCDGLPLAITVVGGLLLEQRQSRSGWEKVLKGMNSLLGRSENRILAVLESSYHELPQHLKPCFLSLAFFKEDATICAEKLIQVWIAEGWISQVGGEEETMEEIARGYLGELINRKIVQVKDVTKDDQVKSCQIHDLLHDLSIKKAKEEIGFKILREGINSEDSDISRHCVIYWSTGRLNFSASPNNKLVRSFFFHRDDNIEGTPSLNFKSFPLLRVLDFEGFGLKSLPQTLGELIGLKYLGLRDNNLESLPKTIGELIGLKYLDLRDNDLESLPETIGELIGLKYLGLRDNKLKELPSSLGCLTNLQVLDLLGNYYYIKAPNVIWKMDSLRHLYMGYITSDEPLRLDTLKNLQTLNYLPYDNKWSTEQLIEMTKLRKLEVRIDENVTDVREFITSLGKLENLASLKLWLCRKDLILVGLDTLHCVTQLKLTGPMNALPSVDKFPPNLSHLTLYVTKLREDPMPVLEKLPNLLYLNLKSRTYDGKEMVISDDGFPSLLYLRLNWLEELRKIELVGEGRGMPELKRFQIKYCFELESLPNKLMTLPQGVEIIRCPKLRT